MALLRRWKAPTSGKAGRTWEDLIPIHLLLVAPEVGGYWEARLSRSIKSELIRSNSMNNKLLNTNIPLLNHRPYLAVHNSKYKSV